MDNVITMTLHRQDLENAHHLNAKLDDDVWQQLQQMMESNGSLVDLALGFLRDKWNIRAAQGRLTPMPITYDESLKLTDHMDEMNRLTELPRISEDQWDERFGWAPDEDGNCELLSETNNPGTTQLLQQHDQHYVWSQIDAPFDEDADYLIVPGMVLGAHGWYLCLRPWDEANQVIGIIPPHDTEDC